MMPTYLERDVSHRTCYAASEVPYLAGWRNGEISTLPFAVSVSHTNSAAVAMVV